MLIHDLFSLPLNIFPFTILSPCFLCCKKIIISKKEDIYMHNFAISSVLFRPFGVNFKCNIVFFMTSALAAPYLMIKTTTYLKLLPISIINTYSLNFSTAENLLINQYVEQQTTISLLRPKFPADHDATRSYPFDCTSRTVRTCSC